jgi:O-antigen biosynthesis protein
LQGHLRSIGVRFEHWTLSAKWYLAIVIRPFLSLVRRFLAHPIIAGYRYRKWVRTYEVLTPQLRGKLVASIAAWPSQPLISVIMPSYNIAPKWMIEAIESVRRQIYPHWELCISDDASTLAAVRPLLERYAAQDPRIHVTFRSENGHISVNSNTALTLASGDYIALLDADDTVSEDALFWVAREIALNPDVDLLFSDEDKIDEYGKRSEPYFKSAWNPALMLSQNAFSHLGVYRRKLVQDVGGFRIGYEGSQDYDLVLRCAEVTTINRIRHIPRVLYHWRTLPGSAASGPDAKSYTWEAGKTAILDHLLRVRLRARVGPVLKSYYQIDYDISGPASLVSIIVPTTLSSLTTANCLRSILNRSTYGAFELLLLVYSAHLNAARSRPEFSEILADPRVRVVQHDESTFNFSRVSNLGARFAHGAYFCFLNDDVEVITPSWLERLLARGMLDGVGPVGAMLYYPSSVIQHAGVILGIDHLADHVFKRRGRVYPGYFGRGILEQDYSCVTAACMVVKRESFEVIGGFDETLPVAFNDVDLCIKIRLTGARIVWTPSVEMYHHESLSLGHHDSPRRRDQFQRDIKTIRERWKDVLDADPCYNPNLSLARASAFFLAWPPRLPYGEQLQAIDVMGSISRTSQLNARGCAESLTLDRPPALHRDGAA